MQNSGDPRREVRSVRLEFPAAQRLFKRQLPVHAGVDRIGLIAVGDNRLVAQNAHRGINDQRRIGQLRGIVSLRADPLSVRDEDAVAAVFTAAHDEVRGRCFAAVRRLAQYDTPTGVGVLLKIVFE